MNIFSPRLIVATILAAVGLTGLVIGWEYEFGSARRMGPGYFPVVLSGVLFVLALLEVVSALLKPNLQHTGPLDWQPFIAILCAVAAFALTIPLFGLIPAFIVVIGLSTCAESGYGLKPLLILSVLSCIGAWLVFSKLLGMTLPLFDLPI